MTLRFLKLLLPVFSIASMHTQAQVCPDQVIYSNLYDIQGTAGQKLIAFAKEMTIEAKEMVGLAKQAPTTKSNVSGENIRNIEILKVRLMQEAVTKYLKERKRCESLPDAVESTGYDRKNNYVTEIREIRKNGPEHITSRGSFDCGEFPLSGTSASGQRSIRIKVEDVEIKRVSDQAINFTVEATSLSAPMVMNESDSSECLDQMAAADWLEDENIELQATYHSREDLLEILSSESKAFNVIDDFSRRYTEPLTDRFNRNVEKNQVILTKKAEERLDSSISWWNDLVKSTMKALTIEKEEGTR